MNRFLIAAAGLVLMVAPAFAGAEAERIIEEAKLVCNQLDNGVFDAGKAVTEIDLNGDGTADEIIDESLFGCSSAASLYCGSGGCALHAVVGDTVTSWQALSWKTIDWNQDKVLLIGRDGGWCGGMGAEYCYEALNWLNGRFMTVMPPLE